MLLTKNVAELLPITACCKNVETISDSPSHIQSLISFAQDIA